MMRPRLTGRTPSRQADDTSLDHSSTIAGPKVVAYPATATGPDGSRFELVIVCTGNRFRSPLAAAVVEQLVAGLPVEVTSLGTLDLHGSPPLRTAVKQANRLGLDLADHQARTLVGTDLSRADLVVGFERAHIGAAVLEANAPRERSFLLTEIVELLDTATVQDGDPLRRARAAVEEAATARREDERTWADEIPDPLGGSARLARQVADDVQRLTRALVSGLFDVESEPAPSRRFRRWRG
jgi:protein-tyrosine phosphatase